MEAAMTLGLILLALACFTAGTILAYVVAPLWRRFNGRDTNR